MRFDAGQLQEELSRRSGRRVRLFLTDNRRRMVSARNLGALVEVRLQRIFLDSDPEVLDDIADLLGGKRTDRAALRRFIDERFRDGSAVVKRRGVPTPDRIVSSHHDIVAYAKNLNDAYLGGRSKSAVIWGRRSRKRSRRSIRFACYDPERNVIIMNRKLDNPEMPAYFVEFVLFHEMLHEVLGIGERADGRRDIHGSLFKLMESTYPDYDKALRYEKDLCTRLGTL